LLNEYKMGSKKSKMQHKKKALDNQGL